MKIDMKQAALSLGLTFAVIHFAAVLLVVLSGGWIVGFSLWLHHIGGLTATAMPLDIIGLVVGTLLAFVAGAAAGALFVAIWNALDKGKK